MKYKVSTYGPNGFVVDRKINWIKDFREQTGCGLKEAKDVADWLGMQVTSHHPTSFVLDTDVEPKFHYLNDLVLIEVGRCDMIRIIKDAPLPVKNKAVVELERTANKLIKLGEYQKARAVLKILVNAR